MAYPSSSIVSLSVARHTAIYKLIIWAPVSATRCKSSSLRQACFPLAACRYCWCYVTHHLAVKNQEINSNLARLALNAAWYLSTHTPNTLHIALIYYPIHQEIRSSMSSSNMTLGWIHFKFSMSSSKKFLGCIKFKFNLYSIHCIQVSWILHNKGWDRSTKGGGVK